MKNHNSVINRRKYKRAMRLGENVVLDKPDWLRVRCADPSQRTIRGYVRDGFFFYWILDRITKKPVYYRNKLLNGEIHLSENRVRHLDVCWLNVVSEMARNKFILSYKDTSEYIERAKYIHGQGD